MPPTAPGYDAYTAPKTGCAAGKYCSAPEDYDVAVSSHRCFNCGGRFHSEMWCAIKLGAFAEKIKGKMRKDLLSPTAYKRFMAESETFGAKEAAKKAADPSHQQITLTDHSLALRLADLPICHQCVHRYRVLAIQEENSSSDSEDDEEGIDKHKPATKYSTLPANNGPSSTATATKVSKKKVGKKKPKNTQVDLSTHPVSSMVPWEHIVHYPQSKLIAKNFVTTSRAGEQNWPLTLTCMTIGIDEISDGEFMLFGICYMYSNFGPNCVI